MARITLTVADDKLDRIVAALCFAGGRRPNDPTPPAEFARRVVAAWVTERVREFEVQQAVLTAGQDAAKRVDDEIEIG